jgi:hypothetical protein
MKSTPLLPLAALVLGAFSIAAFAQSEPMPAQSGQVIVRSAGTGYTPSGPAPAFSQLDTNADGRIDANEAPGYALLANDFRMADSNHDGQVSQRENERWTAMP